jgi:hypothetical protein
MATIKFTRREIAAALSASTVLAAQAPAPPSQPPPPNPEAQNPEAELKAARDLIRQNSEQLAKFPLPLSTEPAVRFKA